jgi:hypothetical protein
MSETESGNPRDVAEWVRDMPLPAPRSTRDLFHLLAQFDSHAGLDALLARVDFTAVGPAEISQVVMGHPLHDRRLAVPDAGFDARSAFKDALLSASFRSQILPSFLQSFPELTRDIFVHVPKCAGTDLTMNLGRRQMPLPSVLESPGWLSDDEFLSVIGGLARALPFHKRIFVYGHMEFATYLDRCGLRPGDRVFSIIRDPIALMVSQANYAIGRLRQDPQGRDPDTVVTMTHLGLSALPGNMSDRDLKDLVVQALLHPAIAFANQACRHLSRSRDLSFEAAIDMIIANDVEVTTTERYNRWLRERWGIPHSARHNRSEQILTLHEARRLYAAAMFDATGEDQKLFDLITWGLEKTDTASITGQQLAKLVAPRDVVAFSTDLTSDRQQARESGAKGVFVVEEPAAVTRYLVAPSLLAPGSPVAEEIYSASFGANGNGTTYLRTGWSTSERSFTWSIGSENTLELPPCNGDGTFIVQLIMRPFVVATILPAQRVEVGVNGQAIGAVDIRTYAVLEFEVPAPIAASGAPLLITLTVPNAARPRPLNGADDDRVLGVCLERAMFRRLRAAAQQAPL